MLTKWRPTVEVWLTKLSEVGGQIRRAQGADQDWDDLTLQVGKILEGTSELEDEALQLALPAEQQTRDLVDYIKRAATELQKSRRLIETQEYKERWANYARLMDELSEK